MLDTVKHEKLIKFMVCLPKRHAPNRFYFNGMNQMNVWVWKTGWYNFPFHSNVEYGKFIRFRKFMLAKYAEKQMSII